jgi:response regulator RpfG family c-di-GMP phosphodiesterase
MSDKILCVDDDAAVLDAYRRRLRKDFQIETALGAEQALAAITDNGSFAVLVTDLRMPGMDGIQLLAAVKQRAPDTTRILITGTADQQAAIDAINQGSVFRFLTKPCPPDELGRALTAGLEQYRLVTAEKELLERTLRGSVKVLTDVLSLVSPMAFGRASRVRRIVRQLAAGLNLARSWQHEIAAMLSQIGCVTLPPDILEKLYGGLMLGPDEQQMVRAHPGVGRDLVANIPRLEEVAEIIAAQNHRFDEHGERIPHGARVLKVALDFDTLVAGGLPGPEAAAELRTRAGCYDPEVLAALADVACLAAAEELREVAVSELTGQMILAEDIRSTNGLLLVGKGQEVTLSLRQRLKNFARSAHIQEPIKVYVRPGHMEEIDAKDVPIPVTGEAR